MDIKKIKELALANGFKLKEQASGNMDLNAYVYDFANAIEQAAKAQVPEWISVKDKLPEIGVYVMVFLGKQGHNPTTYNFCQYTKFGFHLSNVTHWMSLPDAPKPQEPAND